jgi:hypothetical protein
LYLLHGTLVSLFWAFTSSYGTYLTQIYLHALKSLPISRTPGYIVREECKRNRLRVKAGKGAAKRKKWMEGKSAGY